MSVVAAFRNGGVSAIGDFAVSVLGNVHNHLLVDSRGLQKWSLVTVYSQDVRTIEQGGTVGGLRDLAGRKGQ